MKLPKRKYFNSHIRCYSNGCIERQTGIRHNRISEVCTGKRKEAGGFHWEFVEE